MRLKLLGRVEGAVAVLALVAGGPFLVLVCCAPLRLSNLFEGVVHSPYRRKVGLGVYDSASESTDLSDPFLGVGHDASDHALNRTVFHSAVRRSESLEGPNAVGRVRQPGHSDGRFRMLVL